ncbi:MAG: glycosyl transferase family 1 [Cyanobacteriota bacterium]|nr:glycosyl transferase family 1 [Cyanobacteriota bacterium]
MTSDLNFIIFPDWTQPEEFLASELERVIRAIATHSERDRITLFVDTGNTSQEEANLLLSAAAMNLLLKEELDIAQETKIILLETQGDLEQEPLLQQIHARIILSCENPKALTPELPALNFDNFSEIHTEDLFWTLAERLFQENRWAAAVTQYEHYLSLQTGDIWLYLNLAECYRCLGKTEQMLNTLEKGIELYPLEPRLYFAAIVHLQREGRAEDAISFAERASNCLPQDYTFRIFKYLLVPAIYERGSQIEVYRKRFAEGLDQLIEETSLETAEERENVLTGMSKLTNFYISYQAQNDVKLQKKYGGFLSRVVREKYPQWSESLSMPPLGENGKIRVGYASAYLHSYSGTLWLTGWLKYCDRERFEIYCYYTGNTPDIITERFKEHSDIFHHIPYDFTGVCEQIYADRLHILVFPELGMNAFTFAMAGLRLAPVQCTAWGHPVTTGLPTIDYFLSSELMEPENAREHYSETLIRLPNIGVAYPKPTIPPIIKNRSHYDLPEDGILYLCCQAPVKYLPQYDYIFAEIARRVPKAKFVFLRGELLKPRLDRAFAAANLNYQDYCIFLTIPERLDYLLINLLSDVYLDTITWSGGNTSLEAIACHLPIVTYPGEFMRGRHTESFLKMIDVKETIAQNEVEYIEIAVKLGRDREARFGRHRAWREEIKRKMEERSDRLYDDLVCVRGLEAFYQQIVQERQLKKR